MLSQVFCVTENATGQPWKLGDMLGHPFEDFIVNATYQIIYNAEYLQDKQVNIRQTPGSNDGGKDIIITSRVTIPDLFGFEFPINGKVWGLEPQRLAPREPKSRMSTNSIIPAHSHSIIAYQTDL